MDQATIHKINELIEEDEIEKAITLATQSLEAESTEASRNQLSNLRNLSGRFSRISEDNSQGVLDDNAYYLELNKIRKSFIDLVNNTNTATPEIREEQEPDDFTDKIFKFLIISLFLGGIVIFLFSAFNSASIQERLFQGGLSLTSISGAIYAYLRLKALELNF